MLISLIFVPPFYVTMQSRDKLFGYMAGVAAGVTYGMNPLFGKPLLEGGMAVSSMLFFRYLLSMLIMAVWILGSGGSLRVTWREFKSLAVLGVMFCSSSITLFESYNFIPSGLATTIVYLYPVFVALIMVFLRQYPSPRVWVSIFVTLAGVILLCMPSGRVELSFAGMALAALSAFSYSVYVVLVNNDTAISHVPPKVLTFWSLAVGVVAFLGITTAEGASLLAGVNGWKSWVDIIGLAVFPTTIAVLTIAVSTRLIGPVKTSVLGVFEPITAIMTGALAFAERLTPTMAAGIVLCLAAILFMVTERK